MWPTPRAKKVGGYSSPGFGPTLEQTVLKFPTPRAEEKSQQNSQDNGMALSRKVKTWRTPDAGTHNNVASPCRKLQNGEIHSSGGHHIQVRLVDQVMMYPTPTQRDWRHGRASEKTMEKGGRPLNEVVVNWPTPGGLTGHNSGRLDEYGGKHNPLRGTEQGKQALNPDWVEWLMGFPIGWSDVEPFTGIDFMEEGNVEFWEKNIDVWWLGDPADVGPPTGVIPRTTDQKRNRVNRLKALGNGQVPLCVVVAWSLLIGAPSVPLYTSQEHLSGRRLRKNRTERM
jgi:hypothetical protein